MDSLKWFGFGALATWFAMILVPPLALAFGVFIHHFFPEIEYSQSWWLVAWIAIGLVVLDLIRSVIGTTATLCLVAAALFFLLA